MICIDLLLTILNSKNLWNIKKYRIRRRIEIQRKIEKYKIEVIK